MLRKSTVIDKHPKGLPARGTTFLSKKKKKKKKHWSIEKSKNRPTQKDSSRKTRQENSRGWQKWANFTVFSIAKCMKKAFWQTFSLARNIQTTLQVVYSIKAGKRRKLSEWKRPRPGPDAPSLTQTLIIQSVYFNEAFSFHTRTEMVRLHSNPATFRLEWCTALYRVDQFTRSVGNATLLLGRHSRRRQILKF